MHGVLEFNEIGAIPSGIEWNTEHILSDKSPAGAVLHAITGYHSEPTLAGLIAYIGYWTFIVLAYYAFKSGKVDKLVKNLFSSFSFDYINNFFII